MQLATRAAGLIALLAALLLPAMPALAQSAAVPAKAPSSGNWKQLSAKEQRALAPLAERWGEISEPQRSKWLTIARNFDQLSAAEQQVMQTRMREWVALSPVQRNQARLNFNSVQSVSKDEKRTRWDEYQALSDEDKRKLSAGVLGAARTAAPSPRPVSSDRLVQPTLRTVPTAALPPRTPIDGKTLLPIPPAPAPADAPPAATPGSTTSEPPTDQESTSP